jgi:Amt family ammonium transporter
MCLIIFQMQTGFALVEAGIVRSKNTINIMMKNIADVCIGGLAFWIFGYALMFGRGQFSTPFFGSGDFFLDTKFDDVLMGPIVTLFFYQMSYATTSNTIVSGAIAERARFSSYCLLTFCITLLYSLGAGWMWGEHGWLRNLGAADLSGGVIHIVGGSAGIACAWFIGPRIGRYDKGKETLPMGNPMNACVGMFILWWGWLAFNAGCSYGVTGGKWAYGVRGGVGTALATWGAGAVSIIYSMIKNKGKVDIYEVVTGILGSLSELNFERHFG